MKHTYTIDELIQAVDNSFSIASVLNKLNIAPAGGNYSTIKKRIKNAGIDISHFTGQGHMLGKKHPNIKKRSLETILVENSGYTSSYHLKNRLLSEGTFDTICSCCEQTEWLSQPIPLELDHKNGDRNDNRIENLRLLCPNCHALTPTYRGRNIKHRTDAIRQTSHT